MSNMSTASRCPSMSVDTDSIPAIDQHHDAGWSNVRAHSAKRKCLAVPSGRNNDENAIHQDDEERISSLDQAIANESVLRKGDTKFLNRSSRLQKTGSKETFHTDPSNQMESPLATQSPLFKRRRFQRRNSFVVHRNRHQ